jgi:carboxylesterase type B
VARDPLGILRALRQREVEHARQALAVCVHAEAAAADRIAAIDDAVRLDREANRDVAGANRFADMFSLRLAAVQAKRVGAVADQVVARDRSAAARDAVVTARTAAKSVETLIGERLAEAEVEGAKREQHVLDDISRARFGPQSRLADPRKLKPF